VTASCQPVAPDAGGQSTQSPQRLPQAKSNLLLPNPSPLHAERIYSPGQICSLQPNHALHTTYPARCSPCHPSVGVYKRWHVAYQCSPHSGVFHVDHNCHNASLPLLTTQMAEEVITHSFVRQDTLIGPYIVYENPRFFFVRSEICSWLKS
jgi:hypothetical protein